MAAIGRIGGARAMATRWRRRRMCVLVAGGASPAALRTVSASGAFLETAARPGLGDSVELRHPEAGAIRATVRSLAPDGVELGFPLGEASVAFALAAIAADMSRP
ncbi:MAG TPA: hypothetical protein VEA60_11350 [Allosphingosinicella sp.]|nr:hypothetical protein [Allosphingosinicella sp.]